jgi:hypothetical protein
MKTVYIAHPLAGTLGTEWGDMAANVERYLKFVAYAMHKGFVVITWVHHYMTHTRGYTSGTGEYYLGLDKELLKSADELWLAGPVAVSEGMEQELEWAMEMKKTIVHNTVWDDFDFDPLRCPRCGIGRVFDGDGNCGICCRWSDEVIELMRAKWKKDND